MRQTDLLVARRSRTRPLRVRSMRLVVPAAGIAVGFVLSMGNGAHAMTGDTELASSRLVTNPFLKLIPSSPPLASNSASLVAALAGDGAPVATGAAINVVTSRNTDPAVTVTCSQTGWGTCPFDGYNPVHIPAGAVPGPDVDHWLAVHNVDAGTWSDMWYDSSWDSNHDLARTRWGGVYSDRDPVHALAGSGSGSGIAIQAGLVSAAQLSTGVIPHALAITISRAQANSYVYPATKTDGAYTGSNGIPEGTRLQLSPQYDTRQIADPKQRAIAVALQKYGAYVRDQTSHATNIALTAQAETQFPWDYYALTQIPWDKLRVLATCQCR